MEIIKQEQIIAPAPVRDIELTAVIPHEMVAAQQQLVSWSEKKVIEMKTEAEELRLSAEHAKAMKWRSGTLESQYKKAVKRVEYYEKIKAALEAGYYIVPNFPIQMFAIRKQANRSPKGFSNRKWESHEQKAMELPVGEGVYRNPFPIVMREDRERPDGSIAGVSYPEEWDQFEFPINMAKLQIMSVTQTALALKVFDRVGVMPSVNRKKEDPVIIGQIVNKTNGYSEKVVSFMIAWHLNTNVL